MDFELNEEQNMIRTTARDFAEKEVAPVAKENNREERFPLDLVKKMGKMGFMGLNLPAEYGGGGADYMSYGVMLEELARADLGVAVTASSHLSLSGKTITRWGTEAQKRKYLPRLASGEMLGCLATTEPNVGSDVSSIETSATLKGDEWVLNGNKMWISNGGVAGVAIIIAQTDKTQGSKGLTAFLVERDTPGFSSKDIHHKLGVRTSNTAELVFEDCRIPKENMLGPLGKGMSVALSAFDSARLGVAARTVGVAQACVDASVAYAQTRKQFGKFIGSFQLIQELIADMTVETQAARLLVYRAAALKDKGDPATVETSMAKYYASEIAVKAANNAIQIHGSYGYTDEYPVERYLRDVRVSCILEGTSQIHKLIIGRAMTGLNAFA
ncbi:MAG: acyl-CoA dehydrogenase family protein [Chloroflexi bacterium]|nr:acyl-CoA dehydrogenase family protein [Chloroflexota bacterium]